MVFFDINNKLYVPGTFIVAYKFRDDIKYNIFYDKELSSEWKNSNVNLVSETDKEHIYEIILDDKYKSKINVSLLVDKIDSNITKDNIKEKNILQIDDNKFVDIYHSNYNSRLEFYDFNTNEYRKIDSEISNRELGVRIDDYSGVDTDTISIGYKKINKSELMYELFDKTTGNENIDEEWTAEVEEFLGEKIEAESNIKVITDEIRTLGEKSESSFIESYANWCSDAVETIEACLNAMYKVLENIDFSDIFSNDKEEAGKGETKPKIDPSGYVYEAVSSNRVQGVTATVYYQDENGQAIKWDAEEYDQINPLVTDKDGRYEWFVPEGLWQVKYEKEGYETTYSEWLPVPPPQTEVNIGIVSYEKPKIEMFNIYEDGAEITFNKYMDISTINTNSVLLSNFKGDNIQFTIEPMNEEETKEGKLVASKFTLKTNIKNLLTLDNTYTLTVKTTAKTYAGISENNDIVESTIYKQLPTVINVEDNYNIGYNQTIKIPVSIDNISNAEEFVLNAKSGMDDIVTILNNKVNFNKNGKAYIEVKGMLPGETTITFDIEGLDLTKEVTINVNMDNNEENPNNPPIIEANDVELTVGDEFNPRNGVTAYDLEDEDLTSRIIVKENTVNTKVKGTYKVVYEVTDNDGNTTTKEIKVTVKESELPKIELTDIKGHWAESQIINFVSNGYVGGYPDSTFRPNNSITRAEFVKIFNKYFGLTKTSGKVFNDTTTHWAKSEIDIAVTNGVANGVSATEFKPDEPITREQAAVMICNYKKISDKNHDKINKYSDKGNVSSWAKDSVEGVIEKGYMSGYSDNTFRPKNNITRAEAVVTLSRIIK